MAATHDRDIREPLFEFLESFMGKIRIFEEKTMGRTRADVLMITEDLLYGLEIKSDADTYVRLERQIGDYNKFCDRNYVVIGSSHANSIEEHVPEWWGIITTEYDENGRLDFYILRRPVLSPRPDIKRKLKRQMGFLWRPELNHLLELNNLPKYSGKSKRFIMEALIERVDGDILKRQCLNELFERDYEKSLAEIESYKQEKARKQK